MAHLSLSAGYVLAGLLSCDPRPAPGITVILRNNPPLINNEQSSADMEKLRAASISPTYGGEFPLVDGITNGAIQLEHSIDFTGTIRPFIHSACIAAEAVNIVVTYSANIYVDSRQRPGGCRYDLTMAHEMRHVKTDVDTINEFLPYIKQLAEAAATQWQNSGAVKESEVKEIQNGMSKQLADVLEKAAAGLQRARSLRQPLVDSREEYRRLSEACPNER